MRFYCIASKDRLQQALLIKKEVEKKGMKFIHLNPFSPHPQINEVKNEASIVFRISNYRTKYAKQLEALLINSKSITFYSDYSRATSFSPYNALTHLNSDIPIPKTRILSNQTNESLVKDVQFLGGFPIVVKIAGLSEGVGVTKIDSLKTLISAKETLSSNNSLVTMMEFIDVGKPAYSFRSIVIGKKLVFSYNNRFK